jgi:hypothetical protein
MRRSLQLAAAPIFALMALVTAVPDHSAPNVLCSAVAGTWLSSMASMYFLMAIFHLAPWLKFISRRGGIAEGMST